MTTRQLVLCFTRPHKAPGHYVHSPSDLKLFIKPCDRTIKHPTETIRQKPQSALSDTDLQSSYLSFCFECVCLLSPFFLRKKKTLPQSTCERLFVWTFSLYSALFPLYFLVRIWDVSSPPQFCFQDSKWTHCISNLLCKVLQTKHLTELVCATVYESREEKNLLLE